ncbi:MAG TPA: DUF3667 domain-containing protein [Chryseolinea sp.]|mgnify:CR=1 FL=1|nr:DUF3667 domain-containing protein [Chryseolinea sp.]
MNLKPETSNSTIEHICKSCGNTFVGLYCNQCGEKVIEAKDRKFKTFLANVLIATTFVDNKFIKSLWLTLKNPGFLSREYVDGRRVQYMRPLQMFFILNLIYFLFPTLQIFNALLHNQQHVFPHKALAHRMVLEKIHNEGIDMRGFELMYNDKTTGLAKLLVVMFVVIASLPLSLIFQKKNRYFTDHVALSVELTAFNLAVNAISISFVFFIVSKLFSWGHLNSGNYLNDLTLTIIFVTTNFYFIFRSARAFYNQKGKRLVIKAILGVVGLLLALEVYRFLLFFITLWSL